MRLRDKILTLKQEISSIKSYFDYNSLAMRRTCLSLTGMKNRAQKQKRKSRKRNVYSRQINIRVFCMDTDCFLSANDFLLWNVFFICNGTSAATFFSCIIKATHFKPYCRYREFLMFEILSLEIKLLSNCSYQNDLSKNRRFVQSMLSQCVAVCSKVGLVSAVWARQRQTKIHKNKKHMSFFQ